MSLISSIASLRWVNARSRISLAFELSKERPLALAATSQESSRSRERIKKYPWPGNVRELQNLLEQAMIWQKGRVLEAFPRKISFDTINEMVIGSSSQPEQYDMEYIN
ncbi:hypothetical protein U6A24_04795 [Aquimarina gracilis]|uniref:Sigma-54 factor interaction domain-containing protein n=1 Tax=Aquimarina gracilis TaxID=874422 RepID=A0ABU5ZSZ9_9FLAO|nr:hypothetical protein [Aquimarina gracilis]MEB3344763.1 hypothetical protein [Aquimarina gracilis]